MTKTTKKLVAAFALIVALSVAGTARADCGCGRGGFNGAYGFGYSGTLYGLGYIPVPPYHAIHPPVYYGERVRRSYGRSPFARRPVRAQAKQVKPRMVVNATMKKQAPKPAEKPTSKQTASVRPQLIINPYINGVASGGRLVSDKE